MPDPVAGGGGAAAKTKEEGEREALLEAVRTKITGMLAERGFKEGVTLDTFVAEHFKGVDVEGLRSVKPETITNLVAEVEKIKTRANGIVGEQMKSVRAQIKDWQERNKEAFQGIRDGKQVLPEPMTLELREPHTMMVSTDTNQPNTIVPSAQHIPGILEAPRDRPYILDYVNSAPVSKATITWVNKVNKEGNAQFIGEGELKPLASFQLTPEKSNAKKVAEAMKVSTEMLDDVDEMENLIENELRYEVEMALHTAALFGTRDTESIGGITTFASAYTLTGIQTTDPNNADAIRAAITQLVKLHYDRRLIAFISPEDETNIELTKTTEGSYVMVPFMGRDGVMRIKNVPVIAENDIPVGSLLIFDASRWNVRPYKQFFVTWGWENDDFRRNLVTAIGEMRVHEYHSSVDAASAIYDTFANIKTAITAA